MEHAYFDLLKTWLDTLLTYMLHDESHPSLDGALLCPACSVIHGRCHDAIYPFLCMADLTGDAKYLEAARKLFKWSEYMLCDDGSLYNDSQSTWNGITVFSALSLCKALKYHSHLLEPGEKKQWEKRFLAMAHWLRENITPQSKTNINYTAANAAAMAIVGEFFHGSAFLVASKGLAAKVLNCISENSLFYGEGSPVDAVTVHGCRPIDIGYNVEETLPSLYEYAMITADSVAMDAVHRAAQAHLDFLLPDGAWDNSFGTRNFKWTYWGSRTSDGCQAVFNALGKTEPVYVEAAYRNLMLYKRCTNGLLYGGPHYEAHGELACIHHTFCHAKVLAQVLDEGVAPIRHVAIPSDGADGIRYYPEAGIYRLSRGDWRVTVCYGDFEYMKGGHASGGTVTLVWNRAYGPVIATANTDYSLREAHNQQLTRRKKLQAPLYPRLECTKNGIVYSQAYDFDSQVSAMQQEGKITVSVSGILCDIEHRQTPECDEFSLLYELNEDGLKIIGKLSGSKAGQARFVLPVIFKSDRQVSLLGNSAVISGELTVAASSEIKYRSQVFTLSPGFEAAELTVDLDENGAFEVLLSTSNGIQN